MQGSSRPDRTLLDSAALCHHLLGEGSVHAFVAEHRGAVFPDKMFEDLFPTGRGRPSMPADVIATVMVLQTLEGLSDRRAVRRLETGHRLEGGCRPGPDAGLAGPGHQTQAALPRRGAQQLWWSHRCAAVNLQRLVTLGSFSGATAAGPSPDGRSGGLDGHSSPCRHG